VFSDETLVRRSEEEARTMGKILLVGDDFSLLATRAAVLAKTGVDVVPSGPAELKMHVGCEKFDLVVLCHTLRSTVRNSVMIHARRRWPKARMLQVVTTLGQMCAVECGVDDTTTTDPEELVAHAMRLLSETHDTRPPQSVGMAPEQQLNG
jgi:DNA-binding response OmpR family regulator